MKSVIWMAALMVMLVVSMMLASCDVNEPEIQRDEKNEESMDISSYENGSGSDAGIYDNSLRSLNKDVPDGEQNMLYSIQ